jgi:hypothetical protein
MTIVNTKIMSYWQLNNAPTILQDAAYLQ